MAASKQFIGRIGVITHGLLQGLHGELLRRGGSFTVRLTEGRGAYKPGDIVSISAGEFTVLPTPTTSAPASDRSDTASDGKSTS